VGAVSLEVVAVAALLCAALLPVARGLAPRARPSLRALGAAAGSFLATLLLRALAGAPGEPVADAAPREVRAEGYVSSDACRSCHPSQYASWHASYHRRMTQRPTPETVLGDFSDVTVRAGGRAYRLVEKSGAFYTIMIDPRWRGGRGDPPLVRRRIVLTTGSHHQQDYWYETDRPRTIAHLPVVYRVPERRWVPSASTFLRPPYDPEVHQVPETAGWNRNCIQCHVTHGVPAFHLPARVETRVAELGIACEACHGPGEAHVLANRSPQERWLRRQSDEGDPTIVNPARLAPDRGAMVCGQCHMVSTIGHPARDPEWNESGFAYRPGDDLAATRTIARQPDVTRAGARGVPAGAAGLDASRFWPDGAIRVTGREYNGLLETGCHTRGALTCTSCHSMHAAEGDAAALARWADDQLAPGMDGDAACTGCHAERAGATEHTRHAPASPGSRCMNCHMPHTTYGLLKAVRSHVIASPDLARDRAAGRPNACSLCHLDRPLAWAARELEAGWSLAPPPLDDVERTVAAAADWLVRGDAGQRALAAWALGWEEARQASDVRAWGPALLALALDDPYDAVRFIARRSLAALGGTEGVEYDHLAPAPERVAARAAILAAAAAPPRAELLIGGDGRVDLARVERLRRERDERPVLLRE
jgi:hypothetical protein